MLSVRAYAAVFAFCLSLGAQCATLANEVPGEQHALSAHCATESNWTSLFNGVSLDNWELVKAGPSSLIDRLMFWRTDRVHGGWQLDQDSNLHRAFTAGDLRTRQQYGNFELKLQWKISTGGNSGIKLRVHDEQGKPANNGFEMQVLDNAEHRDGGTPLTSAGALYGLYEPAEGNYLRAANEWNQVHISLHGQSVAFYLNGTKTVDAVIGSQDWQRRLDNAPQRGRVSENFASFAKGHIVLQDHFDDVWFRKIDICELPD